MSKHTLTPKLVMGHILQFSLNDDVGGGPSGEAIIHFDGDEDSEVNIRCPDALRLAFLIVTAVNSHADLVKALERIRDNTHGIPDWKALEMCRTIAREVLAKVRP